jgi:hypothetical protein
MTAQFRTDLAPTGAGVHCGTARFVSSSETVFGLEHHRQSQLAVAAGQGAAPSAGSAGGATLRDRMGTLDAAGKAAQKASAFVSDAELTAKIKSKMALDDNVRAHD